MNDTARAAIIGAGPYGLSIAAHLRCAGAGFRIFGKTMHSWRSQMPEKMFLKSEGCGSSLSDPEGQYTLGRFCAENGLPFAERGLPVSLEIFTRYAMSFQRNLVPGVEEVMVNSVEWRGDKFELRLADGSKPHARAVIIATGLANAAFVPAMFSRLPQELVSHSSEHRDLSRFRGKDVTVIGGGQSALETAALLFEEGASVRVLVRKPAVAWNQHPGTNRSSWRLQSGLGDGVQLWTYCNLPILFHHFPRSVRLERVKNVLNAAGAWWLRSRVEGLFEVLPGRIVTSAEPRGGRITLRTSGAAGRVTDIRTDHVIAATGYQFDVRRLPFLSEDLKLRVRTEEGRPLLSANFESTVPGLYFTGMASASSFGPMMRFVAGSGYTAQRLSRHIAADRRAYWPQSGARAASASA